MKFTKQDVVDTNALDAEKGKFDLAFFGREDLDDRSRFSAPLSRSLARRSVHVQYDPLTFVLTVGGEAFRSDDLEDIPRRFPAASIVIDATTMEFPDIALILRAYRRLAPTQTRCVFIYTEPREYVRRPAVEGHAPGSAFDLSLGFRARNAIPAFMPMLSDHHKAHLVAFLGFEGARLLRVLSDDDGHFYRDVTVVFGIPPFQATWDMHSLLANTRLIDQHAPSVRFSGANNPRGAYLPAAGSAPRAARQRLRSVGRGAVRHQARGDRRGLVLRGDGLDAGGLRPSRTQGRTHAGRTSHPLVRGRVGRRARQTEDWPCGSAGIVRCVRPARACASGT